MSRRFVLPILFTVTVVSSGLAQSAIQGSVATPVLTFLLDGNGGLHPVTGIAGSASVAPALNLDFKISQLAVPANHDYVLANTTNGLVLLRFQGAYVTTERIISAPVVAPGTPKQCSERKLDACVQDPSSFVGPSAIDKIAFSPSGSAAALYSQSQGRIYLLSNLPQTSTWAATFDAAGLGQVLTLAISDDAQTVALGIESNDGDSIFMVTEKGQQAIGNVRHLAALQFLAHSSDAVVADDGSDTIDRIANGQLYEIANASDGISQPMALASSNDNLKLFVANARTSSVTTLLLSGGQPQSTVCRCEMTGLYPTASDSVFRLSDFSGGPVVILDASGAVPRVVFVPIAAKF